MICWAAGASKSAVRRRCFRVGVRRVSSCAPRRRGGAQGPPTICADRANVGCGFTRRGVREALAGVALAVALWWLEPWKLFIRARIDETLPPGAQTVCLGQFSSHIHRTTGTARLVTLIDGLRILRMENLHTTQGPQLCVWLSDARVGNGGNRFRRFGRSQHLDLGPLRANRGNTNYAIPRDADTAGVSSVILWCNRFGVSFGAAQLHHLLG
jgi:hypothetical protein